MTTTSYHYGYDSGGRWGLIETKEWNNSYQQTTFTTMYYPTRSSNSQSQMEPLDSRRKMAQWENMAMRSNLVKAVQNGGDWQQAVEIDESEALKYPGSETAREEYNTSCLFGIREALKKENLDLAWDIACYTGKNLDEKCRGGKGFSMAALAAERGYADIYFFLIERIENPRASGSLGDSLMDWLDQGIVEYGSNENYQAIKQDMINRGIKLHMRNSGGCCFIS